MKKLNLWLISNQPEVAQFAVQNGVDRIMVDLELIGKEERQGHLRTVISHHTLDDILKVRKVIPTGSLMVRSNPIHENTQKEIQQILDAGADVIMLPMWRTINEVEILLECIRHRSKICLLAETPESIHLLPQLKNYSEINEVHIGLNDLHLAFKKKFMFELLANGFIDESSLVLNTIHKPFGIGGLARLGEGLVPAELVLAEHIRLGSQAAILSRTFHRNAKTVQAIQQEMDFPQEVLKLKDTYLKYQSYSQHQLLDLHQQLKSIVENILTHAQ